MDDHRQPTCTVLLDVVVRRVMRNMAVEHPLTGPASRLDDVPALAERNVQVSLRYARFATGPDHPAVLQVGHLSSTDI